MDHDNIYYETPHHELPGELVPDFKKAARLEWWTIGYLVSVVVIMYLSMKSSQAMKAAWLEDVLSMTPAICFLVAARYYNKRPNKRYPFGYHRVYSIAYQLGAFALLSIGVYILYDSLHSLFLAERPTIGSMQLMGHHIWMGWVMMAALVWSAVPAMILGYKKIDIAKKLHNKILFTDANTQKADWQTAVAAIAGIIGIGFGLWWADSAAACFISISVILDGWKRLRGAVDDLIDQVPTGLQKEKVHPLVKKVHETVTAHSCVQDSRIRMREAGEIFFTEVFVIFRDEANLYADTQSITTALKDLNWKILDITVIPVRQF